MTSKTTGKVSADAESLLSELAPIRELMVEVRTYPVRLLQRICDLHAAREAPVPDHALQLAPYLGETALRALIDGGYVELDDHAQMAVHAYVPTPSGLALLGRRTPAKRAAAKKVKA